MEDLYSGFSTHSELSNVLSHQNDAEPLHGVPYEIQYSRSDPQIVAPDPVYMSQPDFESHRTLRARPISAPNLSTVPVSYVSPGVASVNSITSSLPTATPPDDQSKSIRQFEPRAATIRRAMEKTFTFLQATDTEQSGAASKEWQDISLQIEDLMRKLQAASISLTSNMSLLDSRRSIAEAHSITKLTELAFFFIPLTFAATLFGMQVKQLESRAPLSTFILLGVTLSALSYLVRLALRSTWLRDLRQTSSKSIKAFADRKRQPVQRGDVPTSLFLKWMFHQLKLNVRRIVGSLWTVVRTSATIFTCLVLMLLAPFWLPWSE